MKLGTKTKLIKVNGVGLMKIAIVECAEMIKFVQFIRKAQLALLAVNVIKDCCVQGLTDLKLAKVGLILVPLVQTKIMDCRPGSYCLSSSASVTSGK